VSSELNLRWNVHPPSDTKLTLAGLPVDHQIVVSYVELADEPNPPCMIEVSTPSGEHLASGIGKTPGDALSYMFERMLPPSSDEYVGPGEED
jgi:hypothetical protein